LARGNCGHKDPARTKIKEARFSNTFFQRAAGRTVPPCRCGRWNRLRKFSRPATHASYDAGNLEAREARRFPPARKFHHRPPTGLRLSDEDAVRRLCGCCWKTPPAMNTRPEQRVEPTGAERPVLAGRWWGADRFRTMGAENSSPMQKPTVFVGQYPNLKS